MQQTDALLTQICVDPAYWYVLGWITLSVIIHSYLQPHEPALYPPEVVYLQFFFVWKNSDVIFGSPGCLSYNIGDKKGNLCFIRFLSLQHDGALPVNKKQVTSYVGPAQREATLTHFTKGNGFTPIPMVSV